MTAPASPSAGSPFWRFSLHFYRHRNVADACITLQEQAGVDVNLLLFLLWHATQKRALSTAEISELEGRIAPWRNMTVVPLRSLRRALKSPPALVGSATAEVFRTKIKAAELEAERLQQEAMCAMAAGMTAETAPSVAAAARASIAAYESVAVSPFTPAAVDILIAALK